MAELIALGTQVSFSASSPLEQKPLNNYLYVTKGGPLIAEDTSNRLNTYSYLVGIVSVGLSSCGINGYPGIYTVIMIYFIFKINC